jgi:hypothetical protein
MPHPLLFALSLLAMDPAPPDQVVTTAPAAAPAPKADPIAPVSASGDDIPPGAPTDDYGLVGWCYGALGEYLSIYDDIKPDLRAIDKMFGSPVVEKEPYSEDIGQLRLAEKRFAAAMEAAEKASPQPITDHGADSIAKGRSIWSVVRLKTRRNLVDAWLFWGLPDRCDPTAKALQARASLLGEAMAVNAPPSAPPAPAAPEPALTAPDTPAAAPEAPSPAKPN